MTDTNSNVVEQTIRIGARPETVWKYWTDPQRICDWWGAAAELDPRPGGVCRVEMDGGPVMSGEYVELVPHERLVFSFGWEPTDHAPTNAPGASRVEVTLIADAGDTGSPHLAPHRHPRRLRRAARVGLVALPADPRCRRGFRAPGVNVDVVTQIVIARPVSVVSAYAADPTNAPDWYVNIDSVEWKTPPPIRIGSQVEFVGRFLGRTLRYSYEFAELVPAERLVMRTQQGPFPMETTYTWKAAPNDETLMTLRNRGQPAGLSRLMAPIMKPAMRRANRKDITKLKTILESQPG